MFNKASITPIMVLCLALSMGITSCSGVSPGMLGVKDGSLARCPASPNCVSSQSLDKEHAIEPLTYTTSRLQALENLKTIIQHMKRTKIVTQSGNYLHVEFTSAIWRFVDDVEFYFDENAKIIHVRSASRLGKSDFGVNRKHVESIRSAWDAVEKL